LLAERNLLSRIQLFQGLADQIDVIVRASHGSTGKDLITVYYQSGNQKSLELEVFLEREKTSNWRLNGSARVKRKSNRKRTAARKISLKRPQQLPFVIERPPCKRFSQG